MSSDLDYQLSAGFAYIDRETFYGGLFGNAVDAPLVPESAPGAGDNDQAFIDRGYSTYGEVAQDQFGFTDNWVYNAEGQVNYRFASHQLSVGGQYYYEKIDDVVPVSSFVADYPVPHDVADGDSFGLFVQDDWHVTEHWELLWGVRGDKNSELDDIVVSPRASLRWEASDDLVLRATFGTGFRAPQAFDEDLHIELIAGERAKTVQAADLEQEDSYSGLFGVTWSPGFADGRLTAEANAFYTALSGTFTNSEIRTNEETGESYRLRYNGPDAEVGGIELNIGAIPFPNTRLDIGYTAQFARYKEAVTVFDDGEGGLAVEDDFLETPEHYGIVQFTYSGTKLPDVSISAVYTGAMKDINERTGVLNHSTDTFLVWNLTLTRTFEFDRFPDVTVTAGVKNLFDERQKDLERGVDRDPYYLYGPRTPRTVFAALRFGF